MQGCEHLRNGHAACGVHHGGGYLAERREHECAAAHVGVRNGEAWRVEHDVVVEKHVDVDGAVVVYAVFRLDGAPERALHPLRGVKEGFGGRGVSTRAAALRKEWLEVKPTGAVSWNDETAASLEPSCVRRSKARRMLSPRRRGWSRGLCKQSASVDNEHCVAVRAELVVFLECHLVGRHGVLVAAKGGCEH